MSKEKSDGGKQLEELGIRTLRISGKFIIENLNEAVQLVFDRL